jgi:hypothetical protein
MEQDWDKIIGMANTSNKHKDHDRAMQSEEPVYVKAETKVIHAYLLTELQKISSEKSLQLSWNTQGQGHHIPRPTISQRTGPTSVTPREAPELEHQHQQGKLWELHNRHVPAQTQPEERPVTRSALHAQLEAPTGTGKHQPRHHADSTLSDDHDPGIGPSRNPRFFV